MDRGGWLPLFLVCLTWFALTTTAQQCALTFYMFGNQEDRAMFTGLTAEELARRDTTTTGHKLTCACVNVTGLTPRQWLDWNKVALPNNNYAQLVDYRAANRQPGSAVSLRINKDGYSCAEAGEYTCVVGSNTRTVLVTPIGAECGPANVTVTASPTGPVSIGTDLTFQCSAEDPTVSGLTYQWLKNGTLISEEVSPTLMVTVTGAEGGGTYTCRVKNRVGQGEASVTVEVIVITSIPDVASSTPVVTYSTPVITQSTPVITQSTSVIASTSSDVAPSTPVVTHSTPVITSTSSVADSTSAVVTPSSTTTSTRPSTSPTPSPTVDPQTPTGVSVSTPRVTDGAVQITLMWSKPGNDSGLTGYQIQISWKSKWDPSQFVKRQSERKTMSVNVTNTSYTLQDAEGFAEYCFAVSALYEGGEESPATDEECTTTPETKPSPPLNLRQVDSSVTTSSVRLRWDAPDCPNGNITHFKVYYQQGPPCQYQVSDWQGQGYVVLDGLDPNTEYYVNVTAVTDTLESDASNGLRVLTLPVATLPDRAPMPPSNLFIASISNRSVSYAFTASPTSGATYRVTFTTQRQGIPQPTDDTPDRAGLRTKSGLTPDVDYTLQVFAVLSGVESTAISGTFTTLAGVPSGPPQNLAVLSRTTTSITLTWSDPAPNRINDRNGVRRFVVRRDGVQVANVTVRTYTFTGLSVATSYNFEVLAINDQGSAPPNHAARLTVTTDSGVPSSPTLSVVLPRFSNTYLVWSDPESFVGPITGFQIRYLIDGVPLTIPELGGGVHQYSVSGIKGSEGKTHSVSLRAKTAAGYGDYSEPVVFTFQPAEIDVTAVDCNTLQVNYTVHSLPYEDSNQVSLQDLEVNYQPIVGGGSPMTRIVPLNGNPAEGVLCLSNLTADTPYRVTYSVEVMTTPEITVPSDTSTPVEILTARECDQAGECTETVTSTPPTGSPTNTGSPTITENPGISEWYYTLVQYTPTIVAGEVILTVVTALLLLVFTNAVSVVVTFLCTRRCYRKKTSSPGPPSPEEKCDHYDAVGVDNVQMQICPAYASVDEAKSS